MDKIWDHLSACNEQEFLLTTRLLLALLHNIIQDPQNDKHRRLRASSKFLLRPGVVELVTYLGFSRTGNYYILPDGEEKLKTLRSIMKELVSKRRQTGNPLGWDVPASALHFAKVLGMSRYGDVFRGQLDGQEVAIKTLKPDGAIIAKDCFQRELNILSKLSHPHVIHLVGATLLAEPASIILELLPHSMLDLLHRGELCDVEIFRYARQVAMGMEYLHTQKILHCDLAARNLLISAEGEVKISDFSLSRQEADSTTMSCESHNTLLNIRWTAPEVLKQGLLSRQSDVWSYGVLLYEFVTAGSVPYANLSNSEVKAKVIDGYRLSQPHCCLDEFYSLMMKCWATTPTDRPQFRAVLALLLDPMETMLASTSDERPLRSRTIFDETPNERKISKKCKVKEPSYISVVGKGGGLLRVYTALVCPFCPRVVMVCSKKTTMSEVVQIALSKCGKTDLDYRSYAIALLDETHQPVKYLGPDDKVMSIKSFISPNAQFVLCIRTPEKSLLEVIATIKQNPAYRNALDTRTQGYLVKSNPVIAKGSLKAKNCSEWQRYWCVLDGSTLLCYVDEEDEGLKQFECHLDFKGAIVSISSEKNGNHFKVETKSGESFLFAAMDKTDTLRWMEAAHSSVKLEPSAALLQATGGAVVQTGFLYCQKFIKGAENFNPIQPMVEAKLGESPTTGNHSVPVNYGKLWSVVKKSGLIQCMVDGKPETLLTLSECSLVRIHNPQMAKEGSDYSMKLHTTNGVYLLRAKLTTDHFEWFLAIEGVLRELGLSKLLVGDKCRESGYVTLKRLMSLQDTGVNGSQLASPMTEIEVLQDLYADAVNSSNGRVSPDGCEEKQLIDGPPIPPRESSAPPPPLPPRDPPPLPPKRGNSLQRVCTPSMTSTLSNLSTGSVEFDEYVIMQPPTTLKFTSPTQPFHNNSSNNFSIPSPITESEDYMPMKPASTSLSLSSEQNVSYKESTSTPSQPISIPGLVRRSSSAKRSILLRSISDDNSSSGGVSIDVTPPLPPRSSSPRHIRTNTSSSNSLSRNLSNSSISSLNSGSYSRNPRGIGFNSALMDTKVSFTGRGNSLFIPRSNSTIVPPVSPRDIPREVSVSDGLMVKEAREHLHTLGDNKYHPYSQAGSVSSVISSDNGLDISGLSSSGSSIEDVSQPLPSGWERGYCGNTQKCFYFNSELGISKWDYEEVILFSKEGEKQQQPGTGWNSVQMDDGRIYYYNEETRVTTWNVVDTFS